MSELFEFDPLTGIKTETSYDELTGELSIIRSSDVEQVVNWTTAARNEAGLNREGIAEGWWLYAKIPPIELVKMRQKGINVFDAGDAKLMFREINEHYPHLKCTTGKEGKSAAPVYFLPKSDG
jgi:hypothetical protein